MGFAGYFLIVSDFINYAKTKQHPRGTGPGIGGGTPGRLLPRHHRHRSPRLSLLFERFLNPERISMPDIDIDFCNAGATRSSNTCDEKYGEDRVAQIITFGKMKARAVVRDVGRVLDMPYGEVDRIAKLIPDDPEHDPAEALKVEPRLAELAEDEDGRRAPRDRHSPGRAPAHASTHAAGVVISRPPPGRLHARCTGGRTTRS